MKTFIRSTTLAAMLAISGGALAQEAPTPAPAAPAAAPAPAAESAPAVAPAPAPAPAKAAPAKAKIYFFRPWNLMGGAYTYHIVETGDDGKSAKGQETLGDLPNGGAFVLEVEEGVHNYNITGPMAAIKAEDRLRIDLEAGQTYYAEQTPRVGVVTGGFRLVPADEARFTSSKVSLDKGKKKPKS